MTAFGKLIRTTAFRLTLAYLFLFALFAASLLGYFAWNTRRLITEQITVTVDADIAGLNDQFQQGGIRALVEAVENRSLRPGSSLYLVTTATGEGLAGNVGSLRPGVMARTGWTETAYRRLDEAETDPHPALVRVSELPGGFRLLVGRDLEERVRIFGIVAKAARWSVAVVVVLGLLGGLFVARRVLRRIDTMTAKVQRIMDGDLGERLPVGRSGDELDRLAEKLNSMLERIESLMRGLKEVSDNIAHDLKTPLTRLRNRAEQALARPLGENIQRAAIETIIEESDGLIRTFDALLMIARAESGQIRENMIAFDGAELARGIHELYEPLAEDKGLQLRFLDSASAPMTANRELISQSLANLVDNAIKYGDPAMRAAQGEAGMPPPAMAASEAPARDDITISVEPQGENVRFIVADRGPGIAAQDRDAVVRRFVRLEKSRTEPGSGLGLSLASAVASLHGGTLSLEDNHPGLRVVLTIPRRGSDQGN